MPRKKNNLLKLPFIRPFGLAEVNLLFRMIEKEKMLGRWRPGELGYPYRPNNNKRNTRWRCWNNNLKKIAACVKRHYIDMNQNITQEYAESIIIECYRQFWLGEFITSDLEMAAKYMEFCEKNKIGHHHDKVQRTKHRLLGETGS